MKMPIFRAKKIDSDEYAVGFLKNCTDTGLDIFWIQDKDFIDYRIDINTLSINFPDMLDSQGNEIFASLQEDGKGGDILKGQVYGISKGKVWDMVAEYKDTSIWLTRYINNNPLISMPLVYQKNGYRDMKVIGIQE